MSDNKDWFSVPITDPFSSEDTQSPEKIPVSDVKGTYLLRALNYSNSEMDSYSSANLSAGWLGELENPDIMADKLKSFWTPSREALTFEMEMYFRSGDLFGESVAKRLVKAGFCSPDHVEYPLFDATYRWKGRIDLILDVRALKHFCKKTVKGELPEEPDFRVADAKQTSVNNYSRWKSYKDLPLKYQVQLNTYLYLQNIKGINKTKGLFIVGQRDNPKLMKAIDFTYSEQLHQETVNNSKKFWEYIQERTFPEGRERLTKSEIEDTIASQTNEGRLWPELAKIH